jgi:hypothetical protein
MGIKRALDGQKKKNDSLKGSNSVATLSVFIHVALCAAVFIIQCIK